MNSVVDVVVIGGGVVGCSVAYYAARSGAQVALIEAEQVGTGASAQAVGLLTAEEGLKYGPGPLLDLNLRSRELHESLSQELHEVTGVDTEYVRAGTLRVAHDTRSEEDLAEDYSRRHQEGLPAEWLDAREARELEPNLSPELVSALYKPEDAHVNPPRLVQALALAASLRKAQIVEFARVTGFTVDKQRVTGIRTTQGSVSAGTVVLAGGTHSALLSDELGINLPVYPIKGEILTLDTRPAPIKANIRTRELDQSLSLVPKKDGRVIVAATEAPYVYDRRPTLGGVACLSQAAIQMIPKLSHASFVSAWGGLRPGSPDGYPILGPIRDWENLLIATGHHHIGVLLAPITAEIISALALGNSPPMDISPFEPQRF